MKILAILAALAISQLSAQEMRLGCKLVLEPNEFTKNDDGVYIKADVLKEILNSPNAWMLDYHVFIYTQCIYCGNVHPVDHECNNPNCRGHQKVGSVK